ncbi:U4/U6.U5 tri-snRNP-associated protein 2 [Portunus trituberculatus]|uniref:ubiquitinyl hydrolase 1 n=1 Tax=Portunus trituberculatus TaxID=210409 RepID=A0A5B7E0X7_PORTR|nr:U4/U6.U5 tri-snRNP-associated protein 2 [Portunus trituberculatus]
MLDFDFEKLCSVSLSRINVYACLVCGKYFQDSSLNDIIFVVNPTFSRDYILHKVNQSKMSRAYDGTLYLPGIVGLNNIKANDYCNVVLQALSNITPLRNYFLDPSNYSHIHHAPGTQGLAMFPLITRFGELVRKLWNPRNFKAHVSPHEMLQAVVSCSKKRFQFTVQGDAIQILSWILNSMHLGLKTPKRKSTIINRCFRGTMCITSQKILPVEIDEKDRNRLLETEDYQMKMEESPFLYLTCDLPQPPLFKDEKKENIIPQVSLYVLLSKFDGKTGKEYQTYKESILKKFQLTGLPPYLILYHKRFTKNTFYTEKNPTIVNFPVKNIDVAEYLTEEVKERHKEPVYDLVANIVHDGDPVSGTYRCHILHKGTGKWYELQDLHVKEIEPQMLTLTESYIQDIFGCSCQYTENTPTVPATATQPPLLPGLCAAEQPEAEIFL